MAQRSVLALAGFILTVSVAFSVPARAQASRWFGGAETPKTTPDIPKAAPEVPKAAPQTRSEVTASFSPGVKIAAPSVVNVYGARREARSPLFDDPIFQRFFGGGAPQERMRQSVGSGVIVSADGTVITNHHVIEGMSDIRVALADRREFEAEVKLRDPKTDLAVLRIKSGDKFPALEIGDSDALEVGDLVLAIGNPFGVGQTVTQGIVSALARSQIGVSDYQSFIQTDAAINPGNSGGALVDVRGRLIGINTAIYSRSGGSHGIGFAIPAAMLRPVLASVSAGAAQVRRPWFGARLQEVTAEIAETLALPRPVGALVASVVDKGPAATGGLQRGDVIVAVDGVDIADPDGFGFRFSTKSLGGTVSISALRGGKKVIVPVALQPAPEVPARDEIVLTGRSPFAGAKIINVSPAVAEELSLSADEGSVAILGFADSTPAAEVGFQKGDVIVAINGETIKSTRDVERITRARHYIWRITLARDGRVVTTVIGG